MSCHDFYSMTFGAGLAISTLMICGLLVFKMLLEQITDLIESIPDD